MISINQMEKYLINSELSLLIITKIEPKDLIYFNNISIFIQINNATNPIM